MFEDYKIAVLDFYREQRNKRLLSTDFENPKREKLRKECVAVFLRKNSQKDKDFIQSFFDPERRYNDQVRSIEKFNLDKFRPLVSFLTQEGYDRTIRDDNYIKLLAWLLDYPVYADWRDGTNVETSDDSVIPEPVENIKLVPEVEEDQNNKTIKHGETDKFDKKSNSNETGTFDVDIEAGTQNAPTDTNNVKDPYEEGKTTIQQQGNKKPGLSIIFKISISFIMLFIISIAYAFWKKNKDKTIREASPAEQCMYWTGQHYEPISCNYKDATKLKLPLKKEQLANQQKITLPDTLTAQSIGKVWYNRISVNKNEFYTDSGTNPIDTTKRLKPLTQYILHKYVSYDRYRLEVLIWSVSLLALFGVFVGMAYRYRPKKILDRS